jgi:hypothetical protein
MQRLQGNTIKLRPADAGAPPLELTPEIRRTHLYVCGSTGTGKSKLLEYMIRQDIAQWHDSKCGALIIDPHGSLCDSVMNWLAWNEDVLGDVPIVPIDLRRSDWTIGYNVLRPRPTADTSVIVNNFVQAMSYVFGVDGTAQTPLFARQASNVLWALYENKMTLLEAEYLIDQLNKRIRGEITHGIAKRSVAQAWEFANMLSPRDFDAQISSTLNRFHPFLRNEKLRLMFGHTGESLDLGKALEQGQIILLNLSTEGVQVSEEDAALFATLVMSDLWVAAKDRGKGTDERDMKPFYVYVDEFQNFITPTIAKNLDQARGYGLHLTLANQFPRQILHSGANGPAVYDSVMANARSKIVFETRGEENLRPLALDLFMGTMNPDEIKDEIYSTKVMGYVEETRTVRGRSESWSDATGEFTGETGTESFGGAIHGTDEQDPSQWNRSQAVSDGTSHMSVQGGARSESEVPFLKPIMGKELSSRQFRPIEEQIFRAMAVLHDQEQRHAVARLVGRRVPTAIVTPNVQKMPTTTEMAAAYLKRAYEKLPFALPKALAEKNVDERERKFRSGDFQPTAEPTTARRRIVAASAPIESQTQPTAEPLSARSVKKRPVNP